MGGDREEILRNISDDLVAGVRDDAARRAILALLRVVEIDAETIRQLKEEVQRLRDENNRLKGEQGKPDIRPKNKSKNKDVSSERERKGKKGKGNRTRGSKKDQLKVDRTEICELDRSQLPADAEFKGYGEVTVQDLTIATDNIRILSRNGGKVKKSSTEGGRHGYHSAVEYCEWVGTRGRF